MLLARLLTLANGALLGLRPGRADAEPPPETTRIRLVGSRALCFAPQFVAAELLHAEGFSDVQYILSEPSAEILAAGDGDLSLGLGVNFILRIDTGKPVVIVAGGHVGCYELFGTSRIRLTKDLKGRAVAVPSVGTALTCSCRCSRMWDSMPGKTSTGSPFLPTRPCGSSPNRRSMRSCASRRSHKSSGRGESATFSSTRRQTGRGPNTSAA